MPIYFIGVWKNMDEILSIKMECDWFYPSTSSNQEYCARYKKWKHATYHPIVVPST